ncbi:MAG TPA: hypothetical protein VKV74_17085 [Bryobacteraceae bacterium]|nr:hypothetical protein [Bryobacteraceae bacterium]
MTNTEIRLCALGLTMEFAARGGWAQASLNFVPVTPCRIADTRGYGFSGVFGPPSLAASTERDFPIQGSSRRMPSTALAYDLNIAVVRHGVPTTPTAYMNYNWTCYPAHVVRVNGVQVYEYLPPRNDLAYVGLCLTQAPFFRKQTGVSASPT